MRNKIGYPDIWRDYSSLTIGRADFYENVSRATRFETKRQAAKIGQPVDKSEWIMSPPTVNAYYDPQLNDINFPAGVLAPPLYDVKMDDAPNYGDTGGTIGHELTHGFDDSGPPVRWRRQPAGLVDEGRCAEVREARAMHPRSVFPVHDRG